MQGSTLTCTCYAAGVILQAAATDMAMPEDISGAAEPAKPSSL